MKVNCSVIIITKNEAQNIESCLRSVEFCDDVIVVDAESSDATVAIAKDHTPQVFIKRWEGFAAAKQFGVSKSTVHMDVARRLRSLNPQLYSEVREILDINKAQRHIRGGLATREKYKSMKEENK